MGNSGTERQSLVLMRFLDANRYLLRLETRPAPSGTKPDSGKRFMTGALTADPYLWQRGGADAATIRPGRTPARKSTGSRKICGIKATAALPQRETDVQTLA